MVLDPSVIETVYWYCGIVGTLIFLLKVALPVDTGSEIVSDFTSITDTDASFHLLTIEGISAFFMTSGWMGWISFTQMHFELKISMVIALFSGILGFLLFAWLLSLTKKMEQTVPYDYATLVDKEGKAYLRFEPKGRGKIQIEFNGKLETLDALNNSEELIDSFAQIKVVKVENNVIYIEKN